MINLCTMPGCERARYARSLCNMHWRRWRKYGDPEWRFFVRAQSGSPRAWIRGNVGYAGSECLIWPYARRQNGFPKMSGGSPARMMCELAHGPAPHPDYQVAHSCGKGHEGCLAPLHLRWATAKENHADKLIHGTHLCGEKIMSAKLTERDVLSIRRLAKSKTHRDIADAYGVSRATVTRVINRTIWRHVS